MPPAFLSLLKVYLFVLFSPRQRKIQVTRQHPEPSLILGRLYTKEKNTHVQKVAVNTPPT